jgi:hypothetical protein
MRQDENITLRNLTTHLKAIHPANILGGIWLIRDFYMSQFHNGQDPNGKNEHPLFKEAAEDWAYYSESTAATFPELLSDYAKLLDTFAAYLSINGLTEACAEIARIQLGLEIQPSTLCEPKRAARWKDALACAVAIGGGVLLEVTCSGQDPWRHFVGLLALLLVAVPVWKLAKRSAQRSAPALNTQPMR